MVVSYQVLSYFIANFMEVKFQKANLHKVLIRRAVCIASVRANLSVTG